LLSQKLWVHLANALSPPKGNQAIFYMFVYLLDALCVDNSFLAINWTWTPRDLAVHIYCKLIYECNHRGVMEKLTDHFLISLYKLIFEEDPSCMSHGAMEAVSEIASWFSSSNGTLLRVFDRKKSLRLLPRYVINKLVMQYVVYRLSTRLSGALHTKQKARWPALPMQNGLYEIKNLKVADTEGNAIEKFTFGCLEFNSYDPRNVCKDHYVRIHYQWLSRTFHRPEEEAWKNCYNASKSREPANFSRISQVNM